MRNKFGKELPLIAILTYGLNKPTVSTDTLITIAAGSIGNIIKFKRTPNTAFSKIEVTTFEPLFAKALAEAAVEELDKLNRYYKSEFVNEKIKFTK